MRPIWISAIALAAATGGAQAQQGETPDARQMRIAPQIEAVLDCRGESGDAAQAACFRAAADRLEAALQAGDLAAATREEVEEVRRRSFGLPELSGAGDALTALTGLAASGGDESDAIAVEVVEIERRFDNTYDFTTADGQHWRQSGGRAPNSFGRGPHTGVIRPGMANSYFLELEGFPQVRVQRVD